MNETKLRERLLDLATDAPKAFTMPPALARRARRRIALTIISSVVLVAALLAGGIVGVRGLEGGGNKPIVRPTQSPTPTSRSTPIPLGAVKPGTYVLETTTHLPSLRVTLTVPTGWRTLLGTEVVRGREGSARWMGVFFSLVDSIYVDPCHFERGVVAIGPTVDDLATALVNQPGHPGTTPTDVTLDGYAGKYVQGTVPQHLNLANCDSGEFRIWRTPTGGVALMGPGLVGELWILDVHNTRVVVVAVYGPRTSARDRAELRQIVASVHIEAIP
jgi:hypothetical protein